MQTDEAIIYYILAYSKDIPTITFDDIKKAYQEAKEFGLPPSEVLPDLISTNLLFIYEDGGKIYTEQYSVPYILVNITDKIREFEERGVDLLGFLHTHPPQPSMPSIHDIDTAYEIQTHFPRCILAIKNYYSTFMFRIDPNIYISAWQNIKKQYERILHSIEADFVIPVSQAIRKNEETEWITEQLMIFNKMRSTQLDLIALNYLLQSQILTLSVYAHL